MGTLVERRKDSSNPRIFPEKLKEVKIMDGGTNYTPTTLTAITIWRIQIFFSDILFQDLLFKWKYMDMLYLKVQKKTKIGIPAAAVSFSDASECGIIEKSNFIEIKFPCVIPVHLITGPGSNCFHVKFLNFIVCNLSPAYQMTESPLQPYPNHLWVGSN